MAFGGPAQILELVQAERPMLAIDKDEIEVELPENVDHPWGWEGQVVAVGLASSAHGGLDSVGMLHLYVPSVRRLRSDLPILPMFGPPAEAELCTGRSEFLQDPKRRLGNDPMRRKRTFSYHHQPTCFNPKGDLAEFMPALPVAP